MTYIIIYAYDPFIDKDVSQEEDEIYDYFSHFFGETSIKYDLLYAHKDITFKKIQKPSKPIHNPNTLRIDTINHTIRNDIDRYKECEQRWKERFGDIVDLYELGFRNKENGWCLVKLTFGGFNYRDGGAGLYVYFNIIYPYAVGYFDKSIYRPSVKNAVESSLNFWINDNNSSYKADFRQGSFDAFFDDLKRFSAKCKYYKYDGSQKPSRNRYLYEASLYNQPLKDLYSFENEEEYELQPLDGSYYWNGYHRVYNAFTRPYYVSLEKQFSVINDTKKAYRTKWMCGLTLIFIQIIIPFLLVARKQQKLQSETLYDKLKRLCNPSLFMKNYNKEKVDAANKIYQKLLQTSPNDKESLDEIQQEAVEKLKITLIDKTMIDDLKKKVNPQNYVKNYNAEKVALANDLYSRLTKENLTYNEFIEIQDLSKQL
ncbi:MAG: hypothetical protein J6Z01_14485 [Bacteroidales bacterium]|nr:hypothetical protein [Bacteroidales bacterium]